MNIKSVDYVILVDVFMCVFGEEITVQFTANLLCLNALCSYLKYLMKKIKS